MLSVVIPALNAAASLPATLASVAGANDIVVVDGGSSDGTRELAASLGARVVTSSRGRGLQLAAGIAAAHGPWLLLLHADTRLADGWQRTTPPPGRAGYFRFALDSDDPRARRLERLVAWRCHFSAEVMAAASSANSRRRPRRRTRSTSSISGSGLTPPTAWSRSRWISSP